MQLHKNVLFGAACIISFLTLTATAADSVQGQVVDSDGKPVANVMWKISGIEELRNGKWTRVIRSGWPREEITDANGMFSIMFPEAVRYDLQFHKSGFAPAFAPAFVYEVGVDSAPLLVQLKRGESIHGTVMHLVDGNYKLLTGEVVQLRLPSMDVWYQEKVLTDTEGEFKFQACCPPIPPPLPSGNIVCGTPDRLPQFKPKWQIVCAGKIVEVDVIDGRPVDPVNFKIEVSADRKNNAEVQPVQRSSNN